MLEELLQLHRDGRLDEAEHGYRELLANNPDNAEVLHLLGILRGQRGDLPEAMRLVQRAGEVDPHNAASRHTLGEMYLAEGRLDDAHAAYDQARQLNPNLAAAHGGLGQVALLRGDLDTAELPAAITASAEIARKPENSSGGRDCCMAARCTALLASLTGIRADLWLVR